ncbi:MAG TPA: phospholipase A, partial [Gammaproteobacteria bacterium]|nr:phospholipase A [Gammaproteobacteria bacterium]
AFYKPNYVLPYYYTVSPYNSVYQGNTPYGESLKNYEFKYQLSFKIPLWVDIMQYRTSLYFAYTQLSYWQFYVPYEFIRETDYEPELYLSTETDLHLGNVKLDFINLGIEHQSNGWGNNLERTWNRVYGEAILSTEHLMLSIRPWIILRNGHLPTYNPDIGKYLGHEKVLMAYKYNDHVFTLALQNLEHISHYGSQELTWSFPLFTPYLKGYLQLFSGYGQSLIEYNHRTNSVGIGVAINDWV